jgi:F420-dependent oxidoreductase-like protein
MLEAYTTLGALARETKRVRLGVLVTGVTYRNPALLVKQVTTLDTISGGRAIFGIGAAWNQVEHLGYGYDFPPVRERMDRLDEAVTIARAMFTQQTPSFEGRYYRIEEAVNVPRPIRDGGPLILIGGGGEKRTLRIAAKHADMTHWFPLGMDVLRRKTDILAGYCEELGRDPATIERTMSSPVFLTLNDADADRLRQTIPAERRAHVTMGPPSQVADGIRPYIEAGFTGFTFANTVLSTPERIAAAGELLRLIS